MTEANLEQCLATYGAGLQAELALLHQLEPLALAQRAASERNDLEELTRIGEARARFMTALVQMEHELKPVRETLAMHLPAARRLAAFPDVLSRHRLAGEMIDRIMASDREVLQQLQDAERARREAAQSLESGEATLAAYRRVLTPRIESVGLVNRRG